MTTMWFGGICRSVTLTVGNGMCYRISPSDVAHINKEIISINTIYFHDSKH
jgi:hypothetical protein